MANEIKFVFVGDTADFDKAINSIIKKSNKIKDVDKEANKVRKQAVNLEKILKDEYEQARKNAGSLQSITQKLAAEEKKRLEINRKLSDESLTQKQRQSLMLESAKSKARSSGLSKANITSIAKIAGATIAAAIAAGAGVVIKQTLSAINQAKATRKGALAAGRSIEDFELAKFAESIDRDPEEIRSSVKSLGLLIDSDLTKRLARAGDVLAIVTQFIFKKLAPAFAIVADKLGGLAISIAAVIEQISTSGVKKTAIAAGTSLAKNRFVGAAISSLPGGLVIGQLLKPIFDKFGGDADVEFGKGVARKKTELEKLIEKLLAIEPTSTKQLPSMKIFQDSLSRIGLFKTGEESQRQIQKASLGQLKSIARQTKGLKKSVEEA